MLTLRHHYLNSDGTIMTHKILHGIVNGRTIELNEDLGVPAGQAVEVVVTSLSENRSAWGEGLRRCAGGLSSEWSEDDDRILETIYQGRKEDSRRELSEE